MLSTCIYKQLFVHLAAQPVGFGSYRIINYGNQTVLINYIFPQHPQIGQVSLQHFEAAVKKIKGTSFKVVQSIEYPTTPDQEIVQRMPASENEGQNRAIASKTDQLDNQADQPSLNIFWLVLALGITGGFFRMTHRKSHK